MSDESPQVDDHSLFIIRYSYSAFPPIQSRHQPEIQFKIAGPQ
jgi:hypothetical protein